MPLHVVLASTVSIQTCHNTLTNKRTQGALSRTLGLTPSPPPPHQGMPYPNSFPTFIALLIRNANISERRDPGNGSPIEDHTVPLQQYFARSTRTAGLTGFPWAC